jgi:hypothetical protein
LGLRFCKVLKGLKMTDKTYNGWTNYETWRVNLEIFDGMDSDNFEVFGFTGDTYKLGQTCKEYATELLESEGTGGLTFDYAMAFLDAVNWYEIAKHLAAYCSENQEVMA